MKYTLILFLFFIIQQTLISKCQKIHEQGKYKNANKYEEETI